MREVVIKVYKFDELSEQAKEVAINEYRYKYGTDSYYYDEINNSFNEVEHIYNELENLECEIFGSRLYTYIINNFSYLWTDSNYISKHKDNSFKNSYFEHKYNCKKYKKSNIFETNNLENCPFTGVCWDFNVFQNIIDFLKKPSSKISNFELCNNRPTREDVFNELEEWTQSDEYISENLTINEYEFLEDGTTY